MYVGESSRSGFQRAREHRKEIDDGLATHPLNIHFQEEHEGRKQEIMFRVVSKHYSALERHVAESVLIEEISGSQETCLNLKNE